MAKNSHNEKFPTIFKNVKRNNFFLQNKIKQQNHYTKNKLNLTGLPEFPIRPGTPGPPVLP